MKNSYYMKHDFNSQDDEKVLELRARLGWQGFGLYWAMNEQLAQATDYKLSIKRINGLALKLSIQPQELTDFINCCIEINLYTQDGDMFYSDRLRKDMLQYNKWIEQQSKYGKKGRQKQMNPGQEDQQGTLGAPPGQPGASNESSVSYESSESSAPLPADPANTFHFPALSPGRDAFAAAFKDDPELVAAVNSEYVPTNIQLGAEVMAKHKGRLVGTERKGWIESVRTAHGNLRGQAWYVNSGGFAYLLDVKPGKYNGDQAVTRVEKYQVHVDERSRGEPVKVVMDAPPELMAIFKGKKNAVAT